MRDPHLPKGFFHDKLVLADNSVLSPFVDSGHAELLYQIAGRVWVAPSIIDPGLTKLTTTDWRKLPEFVRHIVKSPPPPQEIIERRLIYLKKHGQFWYQEPLSLDELKLVEEYKKAYRKELRGKLGDLETLAIAERRGGIILTNDAKLRLAAQKKGIQVFFPCFLLVLAVQWGIISCPDAENLYNDVFVRQLRLRSKKRLRCERQGPICG
jgi:predicted nucleic acid-binding protein